MSSRSSCFSNSMTFSMGYCYHKVKTTLPSSKETLSREASAYFATAESQRKQLPLSLVVFWCYCGNCLGLHIAGGTKRQEKDNRKNRLAADTKKMLNIICGVIEKVFLNITRNMYARWTKRLREISCLYLKFLGFSDEKNIDAFPLPCRSMWTD